MELSGANNENNQDYNLPDTQYKEIIYHVHGAITAGLVSKQILNAGLLQSFINRPDRPDPPYP